MGRPSILFLIVFVLIFSTLFSITILTLASWSFAHRGWWTGMNEPVALSIAGSAITIAVNIIHLRKLYKDTHDTTISMRNHASLIAYVLPQLFVGLWWLATSTWMMMDFGKDYRYAFEEPPRAPWGVATGLAALQIFLALICFFAFCTRAFRFRVYEHQLAMNHSATAASAVELRSGSRTTGNTTTTAGSTSNYNHPWWSVSP